MEDNKTERYYINIKDVDAARKRADIIRNTPAGQDHVIYWHQVAMDAVRWINDTFRLGLDLDEKNWRSRERNAARYAKRNGGGRDAGKSRRSHEAGGVSQRERDAAAGV